MQDLAGDNRTSFVCLPCALWRSHEKDDSGIEMGKIMQKSSRIRGGVPRRDRADSDRVRVRSMGAVEEVGHAALARRPSAVLLHPAPRERPALGGQRNDLLDRLRRRREPMGERRTYRLHAFLDLSRDLQPEASRPPRHRPRRLSRRNLRRSARTGRVLVIGRLQGDATDGTLRQPRRSRFLALRTGSRDRPRARFRARARQKRQLGRGRRHGMPFGRRLGS